MVRSLSALLVLAGCSDSFDNDLNGPNGANSGGYDGAQSCWDLNWNGEADPDEDTNGDGTVDVYDCRGEDGSGGSGNNGSDGQDCWDLDGDGIGDPEEDTNGDGVVDVYDCREDGGDDTGGGDGPLRAIEITVDQFGSCAVLNTGAVQCWGSDRTGSMGGHSDAGVVSTAVDNDGYFRCEVLADTSARCWTNRTGYPDLSFTSGVSQVAVGPASAICILRTTGGVECTRLDGGAVDTPTAVFDSISGGESGFCGRTTSGYAECWALQPGGELATATTPTTSVASVDVGNGHWACATNALNEVLCWGRSEAGDTSVVDDPSLQPPPGLFCNRVAVGTNYGCCIQPDNEVACWGSNVWGQSNAPVGLQFSKLDSSERHSCGVTTVGRVACWGGGDEQSSVPDYLRAN